MKKYTPFTKLNVPRLWDICQKKYNKKYTTR